MPKKKKSVTSPFFFTKKVKVSIWGTGIGIWKVYTKH